MWIDRCVISWNRQESVAKYNLSLTQFSLNYSMGSHTGVSLSGVLSVFELPSGIRVRALWRGFRCCGMRSEHARLLFGPGASILFFHFSCGIQRQWSMLHLTPYSTCEIRPPSIPHPQAPTDRSVQPTQAYAARGSAMLQMSRHATHPMWLHAPSQRTELTSYRPLQ